VILLGVPDSRIAGIQRIFVKYAGVYFCEVKPEYIYFAPMEGITTKAFRRVYSQFYRGIDRYYSPFIAVTSDMAFKRRDKRGVLPHEENLVPQLLANDADAFVWAAIRLADEGYEEINLNAGCPMGTVVSKGKGAGLLKYMEAFDRFLDRIFSHEGLPGISIKTRAGFYNTDEAEGIAGILARYPFCEVIIHPRAREDFYDGTPDREAFDIITSKLNCTVCYNGDLYTPESVQDLINERPGIKRIMLGRGLLIDPSLAEKIRYDEDAKDGNDVKDDEDAKDGKAVLYSFLTCLESEYKSEMASDRNVLFKMKEIWSYLGRSFSDHEKSLKVIRKCTSMSQYELAVKEILR